MAKKTVNSDIYNLSQLVDDVKSEFIPDETEETLAISTFGYIGALESSRLQTQVQMTGELCNEVFPSRARLDRNVITHAIMANIENINAIPAKMTAFLALKESDIMDYFDSNNIFTVDRECPLYIGDFEFHLEYDIKLKKIYIEKKSINTYTAQYDIPSGRDVPTSTITSSNQYLNPPAVVRVNGESYIYLAVTLSQVEHHVDSKKLVTSNIIDNKTMNFEFDNQLAYFEVHCSESDQDYYVTPVFEGSAVPESNSQYYCWYQYIDTNLIRVRFDRKSYMPGLNATVECLIKTCQGDAGNFSYGEDIYTELESSIYGYRGITCLITPVSDSSGGKDRKSKRELQSIIPKEILSRGCITTITDLNNYFGMLDSDLGRIIIQKKIDNQIERVYYAYFVAKDQNGDIVPSNTVNIKVDLDHLIKSQITLTDSPRYLLPSGTCFRLGEDGIAYINDTPILDTGYEFTPNGVNRGEIVIVKFKVRVTDDIYPQVSCGVDVGGAPTNTHVFPAEGEDRYIEPLTPRDTFTVVDYMQFGVGNKYIYTGEYITREDKAMITVTDKNLECFDFEEAYYTVNGVTKYFDKLPIVAYDIPQGTKVNFGIKRKLNTKYKGIIYFTYNGITYKLHQKTSAVLSDILNFVGLNTGTVESAESSDPDIILLTEDGNIGDITPPEPPEPPVPTVEPYVLGVVDSDKVPPVETRDENEWFYIVEKYESIDGSDERTNINDSTEGDENQFIVKVVDRDHLPPVEERKENEWYYIVEDYNPLTDEINGDRTNINNETISDNPYVLNVVNEDDLPPVEERKENEWYYIVEQEVVPDDPDEPDDPDQPVGPTELIGKEYNIDVLQPFQPKSVTITVHIDGNVYNIAVTQDRFVIENGLYITEGDNDPAKVEYIDYVPVLEQDRWPSELVIGDIITYTLMYKSTAFDYTPKITLKLSRGLEYVLFSNMIQYPGKNPIQFEPGEVDLTKEAGFLYTNPYAININSYRLYSAFYMMSMDENPYLHFEYVNDKSNIQFIATNINWTRPFSGVNKDRYLLRTTLTQSVQEDLGLMPETDSGVPLIRVYAVFYRNGEPYRYKALNLINYEQGSYSFTFEQEFYAQDIFDNDNNIRVTNCQVTGQEEYHTTLLYNGKDFVINNGGVVNLSAILYNFGIVVTDITEVISSNPNAITVVPTTSGGVITECKIYSMSNFFGTETLTISSKSGETISISMECSFVDPTSELAEYGYFNPTTDVKLYALCGIPDISGTYSKYGFDSICPGLKEWTLTNVYTVVNGVTFYHNYSEIMGSRATPYGDSIMQDGKVVMDLKGYFVGSVPMLGYDYCQDEILVQNAINALNYRKAYIDNALIVLENSFGIDFKLFNTYGPSHTYYIVRDTNTNGLLDDSIEFIDRVNLTLNFRIKLVATNDSYTRDNIIEEIKDYIEDFEDLGELHIPNLVTQITTNYKEQITYFEYMGFNDYGADIQHIYKLDDSQIPIHIPPEFLNVNNVISIDGGTTRPDINIYVSDI